MTSTVRAVLLALAIVLVAAAGRLVGPDDLDRSDQAKQALAALDVYEHGRWLVPLEMDRDLPTKPPLHAWLMAIAYHVAGSPTELASRVPSVIAGVLLVLATALIARRTSPRAALFAGAALAGCFHTCRLLTLARPDMLVVSVTTIAVALGFEAHRRDREGRRFFVAALIVLAWVAAGLGSLAKGPVSPGILAGALAIYLARERDLRWLKERGAAHLVGLALCLALGLSWFQLATARSPELAKVLIEKELVGHMAASGAWAAKGQPFWYPLPHFFQKFLPWSVLLVPAVVSAWRNRHPVTTYALAGLAITLAIAMAPAVKRPDHVYCAYPFAALLVGALLERWAARAFTEATDRRFLAGVRAIGTIALLAGPVVAVSGVLPFEAVALGKSLRVLAALRDHPGVLVAAGVACTLAGAAILAAAARRSVEAVVVATSLAFVVLSVLVYDWTLGEGARNRKSVALPRFAAAVKRQVGAGPLVLHRVTLSAIFHLGRSQKPEDDPLAALALARRGVPLVGSEQAVRDLEALDPSLERVLESGYFQFDDAPDRVILVRATSRADR